MSLYLGSVIFLGWDDSISLIKQVDTTAWLSLIACSFSSYILRYSRWSYFIVKLGYAIPHRQHFLYYLSAFALTVTPAKIGETIRSLYLFQHGVNYSKSISAFVIERLLDLAVVTILSSLLLYQHHEYNLFIILLSIVIVTFIFLLKSRLTHKILNHFKNKTSSLNFTKLINTISSLLEHTKTLLQTKTLILGFTIGFLAWFAQGTAFYILLNQLGFELPLFIAISIYSIALISGALSFIPGGIGSTEIVMGVFLYYFGAPTEIVIIAPIIIRITSLWFAVFIGLISTLVITNKINSK